MQVKPATSEFKILEKHFLIKDFQGTNFNLCKVSFKPISTYREGFIETPLELWIVLGDKLEQWQSGATSYSQDAFWSLKEDEERVHETWELGQFIITEIQDSWMKTKSHFKVTLKD